MELFKKDGYICNLLAFFVSVGSYMYAIFVGVCYYIKSKFELAKKRRELLSKGICLDCKIEMIYVETTTEGCHMGCIINPAHYECPKCGRIK